MGVKDLLVSASVAAGNVASRERDRDSADSYRDGRPRPIGERARGRVQAIVTEGAAKLVVSQTAHLGARELAKRVSGETLKRVFGVLAKRPAIAGGGAILAFDTARETYRLSRGDIGTDEYAERIGGNATGMLGAAGGAYLGAFVGTLAMPVIGTAVGSVVGGVIGGVGGDTYGRRKVRDLLGVEEDYDDAEWDDPWDDDLDDDAA